MILIFIIMSKNFNGLYNIFNCKMV